MKPSLIALSFLFAFITSSAQAQFLRDANGELLVNGGTYHIFPFINIWGGMTLAKTGNETCPLTVSPAPNFSVFRNGLPWTISNPSKIKYIKSNTWVNIFSNEGKLPNCVPSPAFWTIVEGEDGTQSVKVGWHEDTIKGHFYIQPFAIGSYKIVFCPTDGGSCGDLGLSNGGLAITDHTLGFVFRKVESLEGFSKQLINNVLEA